LSASERTNRRKPWHPWRTKAKLSHKERKLI
jgi:hypothetical protein